jgi:hypothetical protein
MLVDYIKFEGFRAILLGYAGTDDGFVYLRMLGAHNAVKAIWACLVGSPKSQAEKWAAMRVGDERGIKPQKGVKYRTVSARLPHGLLDLAMLHPQATTADVDDDGEVPLYFVLSKGKAGSPAGFFERLNRRLHLPLLPEWETWLWRDGLNGIMASGRMGKRYTIHEMAAIGQARVFRVSTNGARETWQAIVEKNARLLRVALTAAQVVGLRGWVGEAGKETDDSDPLAPHLASLLAKLQSLAEGGRLDVTIAEAVCLYEHVRGIAEVLPAGGEERAAWVVLRETLHGFLVEAAEKGFVFVADWHVEREVQQVEQQGTLPYDRQHGIGGKLILAVRRLKKHYKPGTGDGKLPAEAAAALQDAAAALSALQAQGFGQEAEKAMYDYYMPILAQLQQAHADEVYPESVGMIAAYRGSYYLERVQEKRTPAAFGLEV